jgi:hypothetical protein
MKSTTTLGAYKTTLRGGRVPFYCRDSYRLGFSSVRKMQKWLDLPALIVNRATMCQG